MSSSAATAATSPLWYFTRATGMVALVLLTAGMVLGVLGSMRFTRERWPLFVTAGLHRNLTLVSVVFVGLHVLTTVLDSYAHINLLAAIVPFSSSYRPIWLGLGAVAFDLLVALIVTSLLRARLGLRTWRVVHWASYACWPTAVLHGLGTGTDAARPWIIALTAACVSAVLIAAVWRLVASRPRQPGGTAFMIGGGLVVAVTVSAMVILLVAGPLQPGWARRAGTPATLIAHNAVVRPAPSGNASGLPQVPFTTALAGTLSQQPTGAGTTSVTIDLTGRDRLAVRLVISGPPAEGDGVQMTSSRISLGPASSPTAYSGQITGLNGAHIRGSVTSATGSALRLDIRLDTEGGHVTGTMTANRA
jgi:Ferric reductase like transmembrane component